jgi:hypothetical protein
VSLIAGVLTGLLIAALELVAEHVRFAVGPFTLSDSAPAVPFVLVPLALFWGWTWAAERWAGRSVLRLVLFTVGLYVPVASVGVINSFVFGPADLSAFAAAVPDLLVRRLVLVAPVTIAAALYWLFGTRRLPMNLLTLTIGYLAGSALAVFSPLAAMGTVAGTAAGHAWLSPNARTTIAFFVLVLLVAASFGIPYLLVAAGLSTAPMQPLHP